MSSEPREKPVGALELAAFAAPAAPLLALTLPTVMFLPPYFIEHIGLEEGVVGMLFFAARLFDLVLDPTLGALQDRTQTRWGRRRVWLAAATPFLMAAIWFVFIGLAPGAGPIQAGASIFVMYFIFAAMMVAHLGWSGELIPTYRGRTRTLGAVQTASLVGQTLMLVMAAAAAKGAGCIPGTVSQSDTGANTVAVYAMGMALLIMLPLTVMVACLFVREPQTPPQPHMGLRAAIGTVFSNPVARRVLLPDFLLGVAQGVSGGLFLFYFQYVLGFVCEAQTLAAIYFVAGLVGVPIWWMLAQRVGKHRALQVAFLYTALTTALLLVTQPGQFGFAAGLMVLAGLAQGGCVLLTRSLMGDVVDEDEVRTGSRRSGLYYGLLLMTSKTGLAAGPLALVALQAVGFAASRGAGNSAEALGALSAMFVGIPVVLCVAGALSLRNYPLDEKRQAELHAAIEARHAANSANTLGPSTK
ncbi:MAG: MFS transporter [Terricaulis sp.]